MRRLLLLLLGIVLLQQGLCFEFVIDGEWEDERSDVQDHQERHKRATLTSEEQRDFEAIRGDDVTMKSYTVVTRITSRFSETTIKSSVVNSASRSKGIGFNVKIPKLAFITKFSMNINGVSYVGKVKEKSVARTLYAQAKARGKATGIIRPNSQDMETFMVEVNVPAGNTIEFELHYEELMKRMLSLYELSLHLQPGRLVPQFQVDVYIYEMNGISKVEAPSTLGDQFAELIKLTSTKDKAHIVFKPTLDQQRKCENCPESAIDGVFTVKYDVTRDSSVVELQVSDGYFVQFIAPANLPPLPKNIVFIIDVSGSMWGVKMKQTVQAMQAILDDLTMDDHFNIIDFNHNVRLMSEDLVPGNAIQVAQAKIYVSNIKPGGGTNINEAVMRAVQMMLRASNQGLIDPRSVSMMMLVSDGDPTVGEMKLSTIQSNVKRLMKEEYSLFSVGIGFDVDYDFLERIAMENRGSAQRIYANHDAAEQLRTFYSQISSPLMRKVSVQFLENTVSEVTQNTFDKYFSGSELVVAGKVLSSDSPTLTSYTTAFSGNMDITLETQSNRVALDTELAKQQHSFSGFAKQMWAYINVKQLFAERSLANTAAKKQEITQRITVLAVEHQFVTPLTAMLIENGDATERLLANSLKDPKHGTGSGVGSASFGRNLSHSAYQPPPWVNASTGNTTSGVNPHLQQLGVAPQFNFGNTQQWTLPPPVNLVDNDPHFIVHLPTSNMDVCFNIDSTPGHILNLVADPGTGVAVNGQLIGSKNVPKSKLSTYFGTISVYYQPEGVSVTVGADSIVMTDSNGNHSFTWGATAEIKLDGVRISIMKNSHVSIILNNNIQVMVLLHRVWKKNPVSVDFLGVYIPNDNQYSPLVHGLIGGGGYLYQLLEPEVNVYDVHEGEDPLKKEATMEVKGNKLLVTRGWQKDYRRDKKRGSSIYCWFIHNSGKGFIDGHYTDYIVPNLNSFMQMP